MADNTVPYLITRGFGTLAGLAGAKFLPTRGFLVSTAEIAGTRTPLAGTLVTSSGSRESITDSRLTPTRA